jgi:aspartyl-tRNA(Asn)/glutamyl-tRNA(Gln) amidotransferase subunit A
MNADLLTKHSAVEMARLMAAKELSPVELTQAYLDRIDRLEPSLSAYITLLPEAALQTAREAETAIMDGRFIGPLHGVPWAVKDQFKTTGVRTTAGSTILADYVPQEDATVIARGQAAGMVLLGKLNMTEFAAGLGDPFKYGDPRNPWDLERTAAGSSTGSAIAIAASMCAISLGEDTGGSIRWPAALTGIVGVRPTWGLVSRHGILPIAWSMDTAGPMTRTVEDAALLLQTVAGYDPQDHLTSKRSVPDYVAGLDDGVKGVRVGVVRELMDESWVDPEVHAAVLAAAALLEEMGARVEEVSLPFLTQVGPAMAALSGSDGGYVMREPLRTQASEFGTGLRRRWLAGSLLPAQVAQKAARARTILRRDWLALFDQVDVLLSPTCPEPAEKIRYHKDLESRPEVERQSVWRTSCTMAAALAGTPAITIPCGFSSENLPLGMQVMTDRFQEALMFRVAHSYEQATEWHLRRPPLLV